MPVMYTFIHISCNFSEIKRTFTGISDKSAGIFGTSTANNQTFIAIAITLPVIKITFEKRVCDLSEIFLHLPDNQ